MNVIEVIITGRKRAQAVGMAASEMNTPSAWDFVAISTKFAIANSGPGYAEG